MKNIVNTQITTADGYVYCGEWTHEESVAVMGEGEIVATEAVSAMARTEWLKDFRQAYTSGATVWTHTFNGRNAAADQVGG